MPERILIVGVWSKLPVQLRVLRQLVAIQSHAEPRSVRHPNRAVLVRKLAPLDDVVHDAV